MTEHSAHEAYDLLMKLNEAIPGDLMDSEGVADALNTLDDAITAYDRASAVTASDLAECFSHYVYPGLIASYLEIPPARVSMGSAVPRQPWQVEQGQAPGWEFTITLGGKQFLLAITPNDGMG